MKFGANFLKKLNETVRITFGNRPVVNYRTGFKILKRQPRGPVSRSYYDGFDPHNKMERIFRQISPGFQTEEEERAATRTQRLKRRGKGAPRKGEGKRSKRK